MSPNGQKRFRCANYCAFLPIYRQLYTKKNSDLSRCFSSLLNDVFAFQDDRRFSGFSYACHVIVYARWQFYAII